MRSRRCTFRCGPGRTCRLVLRPGRNCRSGNESVRTGMREGQDEREKPGRVLESICVSGTNEFFSNCRTNIPYETDETACACHLCGGKRRSLVRGVVEYDSAG